MFFQDQKLCAFTQNYLIWLLNHVCSSINVMLSLIFKFFDEGILSILPTLSTDLSGAMGGDVGHVGAREWVSDDHYCHYNWHRGTLARCFAFLGFGSNRTESRNQIWKPIYNQFGDFLPEILTIPTKMTPSRCFVLIKAWKLILWV